MMGMYFNTVVHMKNILFKGWDTNSTKDAIIASLLALIFTMLYEGAKVVKSYLIIRKEQSPLTYGLHSADNSQTPPHNDPVGIAGASRDVMEAPGSYTSTTQLLAPLKIPTSIEQIRKWRISLFVMESVMNLFNFIFGYILMLLVMTYNVWFLAAVLIGSGVGFFVFDPLRQLYADKYLLGGDLTGLKATNGANSQDGALSASAINETLPMRQSKANYQTLSSGR